MSGVPPDGAAKAGNGSQMGRWLKDRTQPQRSTTAATMVAIEAGCQVYHLTVLPELAKAARLAAGSAIGLTTKKHHSCYHGGH